MALLIPLQLKDQAQLPFTLHSIQINGEQYQHVFAVIQWYQFDENQDYFGKPVQVWKINNYASCGPALFMPVQKIAQKLRVCIEEKYKKSVKLFDSFTLLRSVDRKCRK